ncbi:MAG: helix-turn-helix domain-containing protein [Acidobacteria bacterium]|nr:helix-turn-helix domain-containing protein [Acidobacteriota bacterium]
MLRIRPGLKAFAAELRAARIRAGLSKQTLADRAAMTRHGLIKIEKGGNPTLGTIILLADALGCEIADLFPRKHRWGAGVSDWHLRSRVLRNGP